MGGGEEVGSKEEGETIMEIYKKKESILNKRDKRKRVKSNIFRKK